jgi:hypothetical protein
MEQTTLWTQSYSKTADSRLFLFFKHCHVFFHKKKKKQERVVNTKAKGNPAILFLQSKAQYIVNPRICQKKPTKIP